MSVESAKAKLDAQPGDPATGYISKADHQDSYTELVDDTALTGATTAEALDVTGALTAGTIASDATVAGTGLAGGLLSSASPVVNGVAAPGTSAIPSRQDHVHASDTTKVTGPASATDNALARFDGTGGKTVQDSGITVDDSGNVTSNVTVSKSAAAIQASGSGNIDLSAVSSSGGYARLNLDRAAGKFGIIYFKTAGSSRWALLTNDAAESGSNAGSDFAMYSYTDAGAYLNQVLKITRATGKTTFGSVGASAGLELGSSGPRVMSGTGSPEGVVTAPVGSTWLDTAATTGAVKWIKASGTGNTGWKVEYGDTGIRDLTASDTPHVNTTVTYFQVRRQGTAVTLNYYQATSSSVNDVLMFDALPVGFRPTLNITAIRNRGGVLSASDQIVWDIRSNGQVYYSSAGASTMLGEVTWQTPDAWPTSLPGTA